MDKYTKKQKAAWILSLMLNCVSLAFDEIEDPECDMVLSCKEDFDILGEMYWDYHTDGDDVPTTDWKQALAEYEEDMIELAKTFEVSPTEV